MKLKNADIWNAIEPLDKLMLIKFPVKVSYALAKLANKLANEYQAIEQVRRGLVNKYGERSKNGKISVQQFIEEGGENPKWQPFMDELSELMQQETEIVFDVVKLTPTAEVEPMTLTALVKFVEVAE
ncbi:MAG TPA: hypothetical protein VIY48_16000 [Candidatus Paceibacterota bacterium]